MNDSSEKESRQLAEAARAQGWSGASFLRELFFGRFRINLLRPYPEWRPRPEFEAFSRKMEQFLREVVDPAEIDAAGEYPAGVVDGLRKLGAFGMTIPEEYDGLGFTNVEYGRVMQLVGSHDGNLTALLSAHQSIGVPRPLLLFGSEEQKRKYLPRCAHGAISAFALTEPTAGSDPARLATRVERTDNGDFLLSGEKLWCTNGTIAELIVVMARHEDTGKISAFVVETAWEGVTVERRLHFMGLKALANGVISFDRVRVPRGNLIGVEGRGLKIALTTLNAGRLAIPSAVTGTAKQCLQISRRWAGVRSQWGQPIGRHEAIGHKLAHMAATTFAMEAMADIAKALADREDTDIRLEAAATKEWLTTNAWRIIDDTMQIRGGRGYENERSLASRGEAPIGVERMMRDARIDTIFEGSSEIMHLFMAREAVDKHLQVGGPLGDTDSSPATMLRALPRVLAFYTWWYPTRWLGWGRWPRYREYGRLARHLRFADRTARKLARSLFYGMLIHGAKLQYRQAFLFRAVDIGNELFAMTATVLRAHAVEERGDDATESATNLADVMCRNARRDVNRLFRELWRNEDRRNVRLSRRLLAGELTWLEEGVVELGFSDEELAPRFGRMAREAAAGEEARPKAATG
jgi:alkylation response protein AidB-like acyl-CoA dehydrogenase